MSLPVPRTQWRLIDRKRLDSVSFVEYLPYFLIFSFDLHPFRAISSLGKRWENTGKHRGEG